MKIVLLFAYITVIFVQEIQLMIVQLVKVSTGKLLQKTVNVNHTTGIIMLMKTVKSVKSSVKLVKSVLLSVLRVKEIIGVVHLIVLVSQVSTKMEITLIVNLVLINA